MKSYHLIDYKAITDALIPRLKPWAFSLVVVNVSKIESPSRETWTSRKASQLLLLLNLNILYFYCNYNKGQFYKNVHKSCINI